MVRYLDSNRITSVRTVAEPAVIRAQGHYGYGRKLPSRYFLLLDGKKPWRRVWVCRYANAATTYVIVSGGWLVLDYATESLVQERAAA